jgi:hypothetical protein
MHLSRVRSHESARDSFSVVLRIVVYDNDLEWSAGVLRQHAAGSISQQRRSVVGRYYN